MIVVIMIVNIFSWAFLYMLCSFALAWIIPKIRATITPNQMSLILLLPVFGWVLYLRQLHHYLHAPEKYHAF